VLDGKPSAFRDVALLNAAAALIVAGKVKDVKEGVALGQKSLDSGAALEKLKRLVAVSNATCETTMSDILTKIEAYKREEIAAAKRAHPIASIEALAKAAPAPRGFMTAIHKSSTRTSSR
jgi:thymidine phosphorylase